jgi:hypothetical protein
MIHLAPGVNTDKVCLCTADQRDGISQRILIAGIVPDGPTASCCQMGTAAPIPFRDVNLQPILDENTGFTPFICISRHITLSERRKNPNQKGDEK